MVSLTVIPIPVLLAIYFFVLVYRVKTTCTFCFTGFTDRGVLSISSDPTLTAVSSLLTEPPTYTLTARTTGGPPGNVEWTIDGAAIPDSTATANVDSDSNSDRNATRYTHTLMVRGRQSGVIRFTASNRRTSPAPSRQLTITCKWGVCVCCHDF